MSNKKTHVSMAAVAVLFAISCAGPGPETPPPTASTTAASKSDAPASSPQELARRAMERRAVEAVIWGMPAVNYDLMLQEMLSKTAGKVNQIIYWGRPLDWKNQTLTPNPDTLYFMSFLNTREVGPIVI